jgi:hypothetical protein
MRIPNSWVSAISKEVAEELVKKQMVELQGPSEEQFAKLIEEEILEELMVEDTINSEVREMLKQYDAEIEKGRLDYRRLFEMTKKKIVKERNIIL